MYLFTEPLVYVLDPADIQVNMVVHFGYKRLTRVSLQTVFTTQSIGKYNDLTKKFSYVFGER